MRAQKHFYRVAVPEYVLIPFKLDMKFYLLLSHKGCPIPGDMVSSPFNVTHNVPLSSERFQHG